MTPNLHAVVAVVRKLKPRTNDKSSADIQLAAALSLHEDHLGDPFYELARGTISFVAVTSLNATEKLPPVLVRAASLLGVSSWAELQDLTTAWLQYCGMHRPAVATASKKLGQIFALPERQRLPLMGSMPSPTNEGLPNPTWADVQAELLKL